MTDQKSPFIQVLANAQKATAAWKTSSLVLGFVCLGLGAQVIYQARNQAAVLIPYDLAVAGEKMTIPLNGQIRGTSPEYMANLAMADLSLVLSFTPDDVLTQHQRFLNRLTESLHGNQRDKLLANAEDFRRRAITQSFFPSAVSVAKSGARVDVEGTLIRWVGGKESVRTRVTYQISYEKYKGYMHVSNLVQEGSKADEAR